MSGFGQEPLAAGDAARGRAVPTIAGAGVVSPAAGGLEAHARIPVYRERQRDVIDAH